MKIIANRSEKITVLNPMGSPPPISQRGLAPRRSLTNRPIYLVDCRFDDGDILMEQMQNWFSGNMPNVKTKLRRKSGVYIDQEPILYEEIKANSGAAVVAVGH